MNDSEVRLAVLSVAQRLFARYGFKKTCMDEIAQGAHIGKATIYQHFNSKEDLFAAVVKEESQVLLDELRGAVEAAPDHEAKIRAFLRRRMSRIRELSNLHRVSEETLYELLPMVEEARQEYLDKEVRLLGGVFEEAREAGVFDLEHPYLMAQTILGSLKGIEILFMRLKEPPGLEEGIDEILRVFFRGLAPASSQQVERE